MKFGKAAITSSELPDGSVELAAPRAVRMSFVRGGTYASSHETLTKFGKGVFAADPNPDLSPAIVVNGLLIALL